MYFSCFISEWIAPYDLHTRHTKYIFAPPQSINFFHEGKFLGPFVYDLKMERDLDTLQRVYTDDRSLDVAMAVEDGDVSLVPRGYHPCATVHGYDLFYLNVMAGPQRTWKFHNAPEHEWLLKI